jgi:hypothetical protein
MGLPKRDLVEFTMSISRYAKVATILAVLMSAASVPSFAHDRVTTTKVAPLPALGTGLPGLIVLLGGLATFARRRR